jgi:hypothetical protein
MNGRREGLRVPSPFRFVVVTFVCPGKHLLHIPLTRALQDKSELNVKGPSPALTDAAKYPVGSINCSPLRACHVLRLRYLSAMSTVVEIEAAIELLSPEEKRQLHEWFLERLPSEDNEDVVVPSAYRQKVLDAIDQP